MAFLWPTQRFARGVAQNYITLFDIIDSIFEIESILENVQESEYLKNNEKKFALERLFEIVGEAANHLSDEIVYDKESVIPWQKMISMINFLSHEYFKVNDLLVYKTAITELIPLKPIIEKLYNQFD
mgnify:CR=1 FL=1